MVLCIGSYRTVKKCLIKFISNYGYNTYGTTLLMPYLSWVDVLRVCAREHQAVALRAISPILMKICQFKGSTPKLKKTNFFPFWLFPEEIDLLPGFSWFSLRKSLQNRLVNRMTVFSDLSIHPNI